VTGIGSHVIFNQTSAGHVTAVTRDQDRDLAFLAMGFRLTEGVIAALAAGSRLDLLAVAITNRTATGADAAVAQALGATLLNGSTGPAALCFSLGNLIVASLLLRARSIPAWLAGLGVVASILGLVEVRRPESACSLGVSAGDARLPPRARDHRSADPDGTVRADPRAVAPDDGCGGALGALSHALREPRMMRVRAWIGRGWVNA
jgi:hypothetical protein